MIMIGSNNKLITDFPISGQKLRPLNGSALAYALVIMAIVSILLLSMIQYVSSQIKFGYNRLEKGRAFQVAEAGIYFYRWYLAHEISGKTVQQIKDFWQNGNPYGVSSPYEAEFSDPEGGVIGKYKIEVTPPDPYSTIVTVKSTGWTYKEPSLKRIVQARFRRPSWSEYMFLLNDFIYFGSGATVYGKIHSNKGIRFDGVAKNVVSSLLCTFDDPDHGGGNESAVHTHVVPTDPLPPTPPPCQSPPNRPSIFEAGRQLEVPEINFNGVISDLSLMRTEAQAGNGKYFDATGEGRRIILKTDGTYDVCTVNAYSSTTYGITSYRRNSGAGTCGSCSGLCLQNYSIPDNGIIFTDDNVWIQGKINSQNVASDSQKITVVAAGVVADIYLGYNSVGGGSNLEYTNFDGSEIIGLIAQRDIKIVRDCPNNMILDAAILAQSGKVGRNSYTSAYNKSTLTINGSIASYQRPGFNWGSNGFTTRTYNFDNNLLYYPPPYFPTGTEYFIDLWDEL